MDKRVVDFIRALRASGVRISLAGHFGIRYVQILCIKFDEHFV